MGLLLDQILNTCFLFYISSKPTSLFVFILQNIFLVFSNIILAVIAFSSEASKNLCSVLNLIIWGPLVSLLYQALTLALQTRCLQVWCDQYDARWSDSLYTLFIFHRIVAAVHYVL